MAFLSSHSNATAKARYELPPGETVIGRHPECAVVIEVGAVSRHHARIVNEGERQVLHDLHSRNGTFLNGQLVKQPEVLREGDRIRICEVELTYHNDSPSRFTPHGDMTFGGTQFGVMLVEDEPESDDDSSTASRIEFRHSSDSVRLAASPEAKLAAMLKITRNLGQALSLDEVLPKVLESLFEIFLQADRGFVVLRNDDGALVPRWVKTRVPGGETETIRISKTIINEVMSKRVPILSLDAQNDQRFDASASIADFSIRSMICAPLLDSEGTAFGALQIDSSHGRGRFVEEDVDLLSAVAMQAGVVIRNAQLHEQALSQQETEQDLKLATEVQQAFLPQTSPEIPGYRICSFYRAAHFIGGDYFDYIQLPGGRLAVVVADVVGHGVAAAMFMAKLSAETRFCLASEADIARAIETLNDRMSALAIERFVTFLLVVIDPEHDRLELVNAGHMAPIVRSSSDGSISEPGREQSGLPIAIDTGVSYQAVPLKMAIGDLALLYTDGINEASNMEDELFGMDRVREIVAAGGTADRTLKNLIDSVERHVGRGPQDDDMCVVIVERIGDTFDGSDTTDDSNRGTDS